MRTVLSSTATGAAMGPPLNGNVMSERELNEDSRLRGNDATPKECEYKGKYCTNQDVKRVHTKSSRNVYKGPIKAMCSQCRRDNNGQIKLVK